MSPSTLGKPVDPDDGWYSQAQAALVLKVSPHTVLSRALAGQLVAQKLGGRWFFSRESVDRALAATVGATA